MTDATDTLEARRRDVPVGVVMVGMSVVIWWPAFTLGAWGELFFDQMLTIWAASTAALVFVLVEHRPVGSRLGRAFLLLLPSAWLVLMFLFNDVDTTDTLTVVVDLSALAVVLVGIPFALWVLVRIIWPDFAAGTRRRTRWLIVLVVLGVGVASFVLGLNQSRFLTCQDFEVSGNSRPPGCLDLDATG